MACSGNGAEHCCWIAGGVCPHLEENTVPGRRWACGLRRRLGSWPAVHESPEYRRDVGPTAARVGVDCGDYPGPGTSCATCGATG